MKTKIFLLAIACMGVMPSMAQTARRFTIDGELTDISQLLEKSSLLSDFKAVKDGNVWCTNQNLFQETMELGTMIEDIHTMLTSDDPDLDTLTYMHKLK